MNYEDINGDGKKEKLIEEMQAVDFVELLGIESWKQDETNINNGYPILNWQSE